MSLRDEAITHMAVARAKRMNRKEWDDLTVRLQDVFKEDVSLCLDALLDFLQANREAWTEASLHPGTHEALVVTRRIAASRLVAALRGTTEEQ